MPAHRLNNSVIHLCHKLREKRSRCVTPKEGHARILAEIEQLIVKKPIRDNIQFGDISNDRLCLFRNKSLHPGVYTNRNSCNTHAIR
jgi:hypothetical protein